MLSFLFAGALVAAVVCFVLWVKGRARVERAEAEGTAAVYTAAKERTRYEQLHAELKGKVDTILQRAQQAAEQQAQRTVGDAEKQAASLIEHANTVSKDVAFYTNVVTALKNKVEGYGDVYLQPVQGLLDELGEAFAHKDAGQQLKQARKAVKDIIRAGRAAACEYVDEQRREDATRFVLDAFNGKVDSILSRVRDDNHGTLAQEIRDAFALVNHGGRAFREARITQEYLEARLEELRWGAVVQALRRAQQEEQRQLREQIREEERARREHERAIREAAKEEEMLRRAMAKAEEELAVASIEQRMRYEEKLAELRSQLTEAERKGQRAVSLAQLTKRGHVYIVSNVGSLGEGVYKIGSTRRLEPRDRIKELSDASVPFDFDVHAIVMSDDAPALETTLHKSLLVHQVNKVDHRKEFFRIDLASIRAEFDRLGVTAEWTMAAEAAEYRETQAIERLIAADPQARERWLNRQRLLDPTTFEAELATVEDEGA